MAKLVTRVLVADDEESDWLLLAAAFKQAGLPVELVWARDGVEAVELLQAETERRAGRNARDSGKLELLLLDLKMPRMTGFEVLEWLQGQEQLGDLAVVVFSSSANPDDVQESKRLGAHEHLAKPTGFDRLMNCVRILSERYLLPRQ